MTLEWIGDRWNCDGQSIQTGDRMEMRFTENEWLPVRIDSEDRGKKLFGFFNFRGQELRWRIHPGRHALRWPTRAVSPVESTADPRQELLALARLVQEMRHAQQLHQQTGSPDDLEQARNFEELVDNDLKRLVSV